MKPYERLSSQESEEDPNDTTPKSTLLDSFSGSSKELFSVDQDPANENDNDQESSSCSITTTPNADEDTRLSTSEPIESSSTSPPSTLDLELQRPPRLTTKQRIQRVLYHFFPVKQTYERINNGISTGRMQTNNGRFIGQGTDGVFRNLMAKPDTEEMRQEQELNPPSYEEAAADASPEYWESTMISPMYEDEVFVQGLPVGNIANYVWNALVTVAFQFVGFILCYLLHTSHAAKQGSRAGLGINLIMYGWNLVPQNFGHPDQLPDKYQPDGPNEFDIDRSTRIHGKVDSYTSGIFIQNSKQEDTEEWMKTSVSAPYVAYGLIAFGLFIILKSLVDYYRVKQLERAILNPSSGLPVTNSVTGVVEEVDEENRRLEEQLRSPRTEQTSQ
ncbi:Metal homeostatis protein BSD2 [Candida viswanathii]|uniref:Metal homeostatis protein BSD2 n=1 Tax=Candida viswanathii TaxID=5486 RepID=A0A367XX54_9ASCO|nr:Metal homeostatis protein BSD2 [Candida viswanathii]